MEHSTHRQASPESARRFEIGMQALRAGQRGEARRAFAAAVRADPRDAAAWHWLGNSVDEPARRAECLARARRLYSAQADGPAGGRSAHATHPADGGAYTIRVVRGDPATRRALLLIAFLLVLACVVAPLTPWGPAQAAAPVAAAAQAFTASGVVRAEEVALASEQGGRIAALPVREGDQVSADQVLLRLDTALLDAQIEAAQAAVGLAEAALAQALSGARPGQIAIAEAQLAQAEAARLGARQAVSDTIALLERPQDLALQIAVAKAQAESAELRLSSALALKDAAEIGKDRFYEAQRALREHGGPGKRQVRVQIAEGSFEAILERLPPELRERLPAPPANATIRIGEYEVEIRGTTYTLYRWVTVDVNLPFEAHLAPNVWWQSWVGVNAAVAERDGVQASLGLLYAQYAEPLDLIAQSDQARAALAQVEAQVAAAQAQLAALRRGTTDEQIAILEAQIGQAEAALQALQDRRAQMAIVAPMDGMVVSLAAHVGEVAAKGAVLVTLADLSEVEVTIYVPEARLASVQLGDAVRVQVDSYPGRTYDGRVVHIAARAEYTPRNVATQQERANLVYAVQVAVPNDDRSLKPGMPADAAFGR
ncbi:MAG: efflux RND transporter periplasmic adaptor subunit [Anaerolineae bacterium]|nr:efflux RND transporter periplasmic adaptor subunit [Anaerolineae bacterium]